MKALVKTRKGKGFLELLDMPKPKPGPGEVLIKVKAASVCGSDLHIYEDAHPYSPPMILGHEYSGMIEELGAGVSGWQIGEKIASESKANLCRRCRYCQTGNGHWCVQKKAIGIGTHGAMAEYVVVHSDNLHKAPQHLDFDVLAVSEPLAINVSGLMERVVIQPGDIALVTGCGPIGLLAAEVLRVAGCHRILASSHSAVRLDMARKIGIDRVIDLCKEDVYEVVKSETDGIGVDILAECSGSTAAIDSAFKLVRKGGKIAAIGISGKETVPVRWDEGIYKGLQLVWCSSSSWSSWETTMKLLGSGKIKVDPLITHRLPLEKWQEGFEVLRRKEAVKVILVP
jgi:L-iditol 2-dehydrogenase